jgi:putative lipoic acid-binding regulatory protein
MTNSTKTALEFPCAYPLKIFGKNSDDFEAFVISIARRHIPKFDQTSIKSRPSKGSKYLAVTITFTAESQEQLDALYQEMNASERVLMIF